MTAKKKTKRSLPANKDTAVRLSAQLLTDVRALINEARQNVAHAVNSTLVILHWNIGRRIGRDVLGGKRAAYGKQIVTALGRQLTAEFGRGFGRRNLFRMIRFAEVFPDPKIVSALMTQ